MIVKFVSMFVIIYSILLFVTCSVYGFINRENGFVKHFKRCFNDCIYEFTPCNILLIVSFLCIIQLFI